MTAFTTLLDAALTANKPITQAIGRAWRDNVLALAEGDITAPDVAGALYLLEHVEPTSNASAVTFTVDPSGYRDVMIEFIGQHSDNTSTYDIEVRATAGTWRKIGEIASGGSADDVVMFRAWIHNTDDGDGSSVYRCHVSASRHNAGFDRSSATVVMTNDIDGKGGYHSFPEAVNELRINVASGSIRGTTADERPIVNLYGVPRATKDDT